MNSRDPPSRILLLIITHLPPQFPLTNDYLHEMFSSYGDIKKILIFERGKANKSFVEFHDIKSAISARRGMLGKNIAYCSGKIQIHFSKLRNLDLEVVDKSRGSEYSYSRSNQQIQQNTYYQKSEPLQKSLLNENQDKTQCFSQSQGIYQESKEDDEGTEQFDQEEFQSNLDNSEEIIRKQMEMFLDSDFLEEKKRSFTSNPQESHPNSIGSYKQLQDQTHQNTQPINSRDPPSRILLLIITHLPAQFPLTNDYLHELFSPYGDIKKILIFERGKANKSFVEFHDIKSAISARKGMLGKSFACCSGKIQIHFSKLLNLDLEVVDKSRGSEYSYSKTQQNICYQNPELVQNEKFYKDSNTKMNQCYSLQSLGIYDQFKEDDERFDEFTQEAFQLKADNTDIRQQMEMFLDIDFQQEKQNSNTSIRSRTSQTINHQSQQVFDNINVQKISNNY